MARQKERDPGGEAGAGGATHAQGEHGDCSTPCTCPLCGKPAEWRTDRRLLQCASCPLVAGPTAVSAIATAVDRAETYHRLLLSGPSVRDELRDCRATAAALRALVWRLVRGGGDDVPLLPVAVEPSTGTVTRSGGAP